MTGRMKRDLSPRIREAETGHAAPGNGGRPADAGVALAEAPDDDLLRRCARRDARAFETLVRRHERAITTFAWRMLGDRDAAQDVAQQTFIQVYDHAPTYEPRGKCATWLFEIARNLSLNEIRRRRRHPASSLDAPLDGGNGNGNGDGHVADLVAADGGNPADAAAANEDEILALKALQRLPDSYREIILLRVFQHLSYKEVCDMTGESEGAARVRMHHALVAYKKLAQAEQGA